MCVVMIGLTCNAFGQRVIESNNITKLRIGMHERLIQNDDRSPIYKIDIQFFNALSHFKNELLIRICSQFILSTYLGAIILQIDAGENQVIIRLENYLTVCFNISIACIILWINRYAISWNLSVNLRLAHYHGHTTQHIRQPGVDYGKLQSWVSETYDARDPEMRNNQAAQLFLKKLIQSYYFWTNKYIGTVNVILKYAVVCICIFNQIQRWKTQGELQLLGAFSYTYTVIQLIILFEELIVIIILILSPLLCLICLVSHLYNKYKDYRNSVPIHLDSIAYSRSNPELESVVECSICFMAFQESQSICKLKCPGRHVFHHNCIEMWVKVQKNCPICRYNLSLNN